MSCLSRLLPAALALLLAGSLPRAEEQQPQRMPTRDVDITYHVTRPQQPEIYERVRWLASQAFGTRRQSRVERDLRLWLGACPKLCRKCRRARNEPSACD
jgi:hypothetical protein